MSVMMWARCPVDFGWHVIDEHRDHPPGVFVAECGHRLPTVQLWDKPYGALCRTCAALQVARAGGNIPEAPPR